MCPVLNLLKYLDVSDGHVDRHGPVDRGGDGLALYSLDAGQAGSSGQPIRTDGIAAPYHSKRPARPTMGGLMILAGLIGGTLLWSDLANGLCLGGAAGHREAYGLLGFLDDYAKVTKQSVDGLSGTGRGWRSSSWSPSLAVLLPMIYFGRAIARRVACRPALAFPIFKKRCC